MLPVNQAESGKEELPQGPVDEIKSENSNNSADFEEIKRRSVRS